MAQSMESTFDRRAKSRLEGFIRKYYIIWIPAFAGMTGRHLMQDNHYIGHRQRLKERILNSPPAALADYELIELLLFFAISRRDVKPLAKKLLGALGSINNLLHAEINNFLELKGTNKNMYVLLLVIRELAARSLQSKISKQNVISSWSALIDYLKVTMGSIKIEKFRVLFLNKKIYY